MRRARSAVVAAVALGAVPAAGRLVAEWEPALGTLLRWPLDVPRGLAVELARDDTLFLLVGSAPEEESARDTLRTAGANLTNVDFLRVPTDTGWTRDWGPEGVEREDGVVSLLDAHFDGYPRHRGCEDHPHHDGDDGEGGPPRNVSSPALGAGGRRPWEIHGRRYYERDNAANARIADLLHLHRLDAKDYFFTGGNVLTDGAGTGFSSRLMVQENAEMAGLSEEEFKARVMHTTGLKQFIITDNPGFRSIQHLDCYATFASEDTIIVKQVAHDDPEYDCIEALAATMGATRSLVTGSPFKIVRIFCGTTNPGDYNPHPVAAYPNSFILNGNRPKVLVPMYEIPSDDGALATFRAAFPAYDVVGVPFPESYGRWYAEDALHCRTKALHRGRRR